MKNKGGRFVELSDYHSDSQQGHIWIPKGKKRRGWDSFVEELRQFFLGIGSRPVSFFGHAASGLEAPNIMDRDLSCKSRQTLTILSYKLGDDFPKSAGIYRVIAKSTFLNIWILVNKASHVSTWLKGAHGPHAKLTSIGHHLYAPYALPKRKELNGLLAGLIPTRGPMVYLLPQARFINNGTTAFGPKTKSQRALNTQPSANKKYRWTHGLMGSTILLLMSGFELWERRSF